jgi:uncharacterized protein
MGETSSIQAAALPGNAALEASPAEAFGPAPPEERLAHIDFIRGCALFGVLAMNLQYFFRGPYEVYTGGGHPWPGFINGCVDDALSLLVEGKAMTLFSMLFAVGLAIQIERKEARGGSFWGFAWRRMGTLFAIGVAHVVLIWNGDILAAYALVGMLLFLFLRRKTKTLHIWVVTMFGLLTVAVLVIAFIQAFRAPLDPRRAERLAEAAAWAQVCIEGYSQAGWWDILLFRLQDYAKHAAEFLGAYIAVFLNFLVGLSAWRTGILQDPSAHLPKIRRAAFWLVGLGLATGVVDLFSRSVMAFVRSHGLWAKPLAAPIALSKIYHMPLLGLGFGALLLLAWQSGKGRSILQPITSVGRMALTNYLAQSLVMTAIFYGWGLGLYGKVGPAAGLGITASFYLLQVMASRWWLTRFRFGPMEWLWRCAGYARIQPFRLRSPLPALR